MNELAINVEYLLLTRNCVIVPGLGSFTTRTFASQWLEDEEIFLPPVRHIRFNADIFQDADEVFLHSLEQIYELTEEKAAQYCQQMVSDFHKTLITEGTVDFGSIGLFALEDDAEITMSPYECGVISPDYYGLDTLHFPLLANTAEEADETVASADTVSQDVNSDVTKDVDQSSVESHRSIVLPKGRTYVADSKHIIIRLNRAMVHYTMVAAASVLLFFLLSPEVTERDMNGVNQATTSTILKSKTPKEGSVEKTVVKAVVDTLKHVFLADDEKTATVERDSFSMATTADANDKIITEQSSERLDSDNKETVETKGAKPSTIKELRGNYSIVLASAISLKNAESFVNRLQAKDVNAIIYDNGKMIRVLIDGFASQADAYNVNNYLHSLDKELGSAWVMKN